MCILQNLDSFAYTFSLLGKSTVGKTKNSLALQENRKAIQDVARITAAEYCEWISNTLLGYTEKLVYFGIPAPYKTNLNGKESSEHSKQRLLAITVFNNTLAEQCQKAGSLFADVYKLTADKDGYNNNEWMIDTIHLRPKALNELIKDLQ